MSQAIFPCIFKPRKGKKSSEISLRRLRCMNKQGGHTHATYKKRH